MSKPLGLASLLLITTALVAPHAAMAQTAAQPPAPSVADAPTADASAPVEDEAVDVSIPGANIADAPQDADIVVRGRRNANIERTAPQVVSVLSAADIARTGEGNIAGALGRVTGLSVVGNGFVYVRGLGDRYSLALLNGLPLPSPEPLRRTVPLDIFPSSIIASSLVQKSYSANFPGEFGGGVINLTTRTVPRDPFLSVGANIGGNSVTTGQLGYTYYGTSSDWTGFGNGGRNLAPAYVAFIQSGNQISDASVNQQAIASQLVNARNAVVQRNPALPPNWGVSLAGGTAWDIGDSRLGLVASFGYSNRWRTRDITQQLSNSLDLSLLENDIRRVVTDNRIVVNGLVGLSYEFGDNKIRWTNLFVRDTIKQARLGEELRPASANGNPGISFLYQSTAWFARQLFDTQIVGEFKPSDDLSVDVRASYANSQRDAPYELDFIYSRSNNPSDIYGQYFLNTLNSGQRPDRAQIAFSSLNEDLFAGGIDLTYRFNSAVRATVGYAYTDTARTTERREFQFRGNNDIPVGVGLLRPDLLLSTAIICFPGETATVNPNCPTNPSPNGVSLVDNTGSNPTFRATLQTHAGYAQLQADLTDELNLNIGVRYERATQTVNPVQVYNSTSGITLPPATNLERSYWLPGGTLTWQFDPQMQFRLSASRTIARPQFRELVFQTYFDPEANVTFQGNPQLVDSQLLNIEGRFEYYFAPQQRVSLGLFYKKIDNPIETYTSFDGNAVTTRFANAPAATLYGAEFEVQKHFDLSGWSGAFWSSRRFVAIANYTYTQSSLQVNAGDPIAAFPFTGATSATEFFRDGAPLTGQSDHLVNLELGFEDTDNLSQQTLLLSYATDRVTRRGPSGQADIVERPGFLLDFVARQGIQLFGREIELKFEARNITGTRFQELQQNGTNTVFYNRYRMGTTVNFGATLQF